MASRGQDSWLPHRRIRDRLLHLFGSYGYRYVELPILAPTELFLLKSGGELASQMFSFLDPSSTAVSLRPEFTAPIMLFYLDQAPGIALPVRWQYAGPVFRHGGSDSRSSGQFTQIGAELIGSYSIMADAELLSLAAQVPVKLGLDGYRIEIADLQVVHSILDSVGLSERARSFIIGAIPQLHADPQCQTGLLERAQQLHLTGQGPEDGNLDSAIAGLDDPQAIEVLRGFLQWSEGESPQLGQRDPEEVVQRLLRKLRGGDERDKLEKGLALVADLAAIRSEPTAALTAAGKVVEQAGANPAPLHRLRELSELAQTDPGLSDALVVDFGLARGIAYYNGIIFEITHPAFADALGGGGRYDGLARALGSQENVPAAGFAYKLEALLTLLDEQGIKPGDPALNTGAPGSGLNSLLSWPSSVLVLPDSLESQKASLKAAQELRSQGLQVELDVQHRSLNEALEYASAKGMDQVTSVDQNGNRTDHPVK